MAAAVSAREPFEYTATGLLGDKRDTMLQNQLLLRVVTYDIIYPANLPIIAQH